MFCVDYCRTIHIHQTAVLPPDSGNLLPQQFHFFPVIDVILMKYKQFIIYDIFYGMNGRSKKIIKTDYLMPLPY